MKKILLAFMVLGAILAGPFAAAAGEVFEKVDANTIKITSTQVVAPEMMREHERKQAENKKL